MLKWRNTAHISISHNNQYGYHHSKNTWSCSLYRQDFYICHNFIDFQALTGIDALFSDATLFYSRSIKRCTSQSVFLYRIPALRKDCSAQPGRGRYISASQVRLSESRSSTIILSHVAGRDFNLFFCLKYKSLFGLSQPTSFSCIVPLFKA